MLLWKFLDENHGFLNHVLTDKDCNVMELIVPMMYLMWSGRLQPSKVCLCMCVGVRVRACVCAFRL